MNYKTGNNSFDREELTSKYKHLGRREDDDNKSMVTGRWRESDQALKASL